MIDSIPKMALLVMILVITASTLSWSVQRWPSNRTLLRHNIEESNRSQMASWHLNLSDLTSNETDHSSSDSSIQKPPQKKENPPPHPSITPSELWIILSIVGSIAIVWMIVYKLYRDPNERDRSPPTASIRRNAVLPFLAPPRPVISMHDHPVQP